MQTKVKALWEKIKGFFKKLNKKTRILLGACAAVILLVLIVSVLLLSRKDYELLQGGLNANEISIVGEFLNANGVTDYKIEGDKVLVPKGRASQLQTQLALSGNLNSGFLYEYYTDHTGGITTSNEQDRAFLISTQERLAAQIQTMEEVRWASVNIAPGTERVYVLDPAATPATAGVLVEPVSRKPLSSGTVDAIRSLVSHSVQGLEVTNVSVSDTLNNTYSDGSSYDQMSQASALKLQFEEDTSNKVRTQVLQSLTAIYGDDNVRVAVNTTADADRKIVESTLYAQPDGSVEGGGLIGTEQWFWEIINDGTQPVGGPVGTTTNSDLPIYPDREAELNGNENYVGSQGSKDHKIDTTVEQREVLSCKITDITVAVTINQNATNANSVGIDELRSHVALASGIGGEDPVSRVSVLIAPFDRPASNGGTTIGGINLPEWALYAAIGGLVLFLILLIVIILLLRRSKKKKLARQQALEAEMQAAELAEAAAAAAAAAAEAPTGGADIMDINAEKSMELRKTVRQFAQNNPEIAAQLVKAWLKGDENNG